MSLNKTGFQIVLASPPEYERLTGEIFYDGKFVALISQERGQGVFDIETPSGDFDDSYIAKKVDLIGFQEAIKLACSRLVNSQP